MTGKTTEKFMLLMAVIVGAVGTSWAVNNLPIVRDTDPRWKSLIQLGGGLALLFFAPGSWQLVKVAGIGAIAIGGASTVQKTFPNMKLLSGPKGGGRNLSSQELSALRALGAMRAPVTVSRGGGPMNAPVTVMHGSNPNSGYGGNTSGYGAGW